MTFFGAEISMTEKLVTFTSDNVGMGPKHFVRKLNVKPKWTSILAGPHIYLKPLKTQLVQVVFFL